MSSLQELANLLTLLRAHNVLTYQTPELTLSMGPVLPEFPKESITQREERELAEDEDVTFAHVSG